MISWIGGKSQISKWIIPYIPRDIETYCEPFSGALWVYLKMDLSLYPNLNKIVYNDFNDYLVNLFMSAKDHKNFHQFSLGYEAQNKNLFLDFQRKLFLEKEAYEMPDFDKAIGFAYLATQVWSGVNPSSGRFIDLKGKYRSKFDTFRDKLKNEKYTYNLSKITNFENLDFQDAINKYDNKKAFFYIDAPYYGTEKYYSNHDFGEKDHERLANCLKSIQGRFAMSYYYFDQLEEWFPKDK
jgi:DNA adenine methylase